MGLVKLCEDYIGNTLTPQGVVEVLNLAASLPSERLYICGCEFIAAHINDVLASHTLEQLRSETLKVLYSIS